MTTYPTIVISGLNPNIKNMGISSYEAVLGTCLSLRYRRREVQVECTRIISIFCYNLIHIYIYIYIRVLKSKYCVSEKLHIRSLSTPLKTMLSNQNHHIFCPKTRRSVLFSSQELPSPSEPLLQHHPYHNHRLKHLYTRRR